MLEQSKPLVVGCRISAEDNRRFNVKFPFHGPLVAVCRSIPSKRFDPINKEWSFSIDHHRMFVQMVEKLSPMVEIDPVLGGGFDDDDSTSTTTNRRGAVILSLVSATRFSIKCSSDISLDCIHARMKTKMFDDKLKRWTFSISEHGALVNYVRSTVGCAAKIEPVASNVLEHLRVVAREIDVSSELVGGSERFRAVFAKLLPFQVSGVRFGIRNNGRILLADDMGLGKTAQAIGIALWFEREWPVLVLAPAGLRRMWGEQFAKWVPSLDPSQIRIADASSMQMDETEAAKMAAVTIISFDTLARHSNLLKKARSNHRVVIVDESHYLKNMKATRTRLAMPILKASNRLILLSGTPALSRPIELFPQLHCIRPTLFRNMHDFGLRYCDAKQGRFGWQYTGCSNMDELQVILDSGIMLRRQKFEVLQEMPEKTRKVVYLNLDSNTSHRRFAKGVFESVALRNSGVSHETLLQYFHESSEVKSQAVCNYLIDWARGSSKQKKGLVFAHHQYMLDEICGSLERNSIRFIRIDGSTAPDKRHQLASDFQSIRGVRLAVLSIMAAGTGVNLTEASVVIFAELFWNPGLLVQAEDRAHRIGQRNAVNVIYLLGKRTIDDMMWPLIHKKLQVLNSAGLCVADSLKSDRGRSREPDHRAHIGKFIDEYFDKAHGEMDDEDLVAAADSALDDLNK